MDQLIIGLANVLIGLFVVMILVYLMIRFGRDLLMTEVKEVVSSDEVSSVASNVLNLVEPKLNHRSKIDESVLSRWYNGLVCLSDIIGKMYDNMHGVQAECDKAISIMKECFQVDDDCISIISIDKLMSMSKTFKDKSLAGQFASRSAFFREAYIHKTYYILDGFVIQCEETIRESELDVENIMDYVERLRMALAEAKTLIDLSNAGVIIKGLETEQNKINKLVNNTTGSRPTLRGAVDSVVTTSNRR